jgi:hypothetical protein
MVTVLIARLKALDRGRPRTTNLLPVIATTAAPAAICNAVTATQPAVVLGAAAAQGRRSTSLHDAAVMWGLGGASG